MDDIARVSGNSGDWLSALWELNAQYQGKNLLCQTIPQELLRLMVRLCANGKQEAYLPFQASIQFAADESLKDNKLFYETDGLQGLLWASALISGAEAKEANPLTSPSFTTAKGQLQQFDQVLMVPPFGLRHKFTPPDAFARFQHPTGSADVLTLLHGVAQCAGRLVTIMPMGFLFRGAADKYCREMLVEKGILDAVIQLPGNLVSGTGIPTCILVIDKQRTPSAPVIFYNADDEELLSRGRRSFRRTITQWETVAEEVLTRKTSKRAVLADAGQIKNNDYDFSVSRYVLSDASLAVKELQNTKPLSDIAELIRAQLLKEEPEQTGETFLEVGIRDISSTGYVANPTKVMQLAGRSRDRALQQRLQPGDILLGIKGNVGKVGIVGESCGENWVAGQLFQVLRLKDSPETCTPFYLYRYLSSPLMQSYLQDHSSGSAMTIVKTADIKALPVPVPSAEEQEKVHTIHQKILAAHKEIQKLQKQVDALSSELWPVTNTINGQ